EVAQVRAGQQEPAVAAEVFLADHLGTDRAEPDELPAEPAQRVRGAHPPPHAAMVALAADRLPLGRGKQQAVARVGRGQVAHASASPAAGPVDSRAVVNAAAKTRLVPTNATAASTSPTMTPPMTHSSS